MSRRSSAVMRFAASQPVVPPGPVLVSLLRRRLDAHWWIIGGRRISFGTERCAVDCILLNPAYGIALVHIGRAEYAMPALAVRMVRAFLAAAGLRSAAAAGLPIVYMTIGAADAKGVPHLLSDAFADAPSIDPFLEDDWVERAAEILSGAPPIADPTVDGVGAAHWPPPPEPPARGRAPTRRPALLLPGVALLSFLAGALALTLLRGEVPARPASASPPAATRESEIVRWVEPPLRAEAVAALPVPLPAAKPLPPRLLAMPAAAHLPAGSSAVAGSAANDAAAGSSRPVAARSAHRHFPIVSYGTRASDPAMNRFSP